MSLYWINTPNTPGAFRLAIAARPRGHDWLGEEIQALKRGGVQILVSMLTQREASELGLVNESEECRDAGIEFLNFPIEDRSVPERQTEFSQLLDRLISMLNEKKSLAVHCRAGIGRSSLLICSLLVRLGLAADDAWLSIQHARGCTVPDTTEQKRFVDRFSTKG